MKRWLLCIFFNVKVITRLFPHSDYAKPFINDGMLIGFRRKEVLKVFLELKKKEMFTSKKKKISLEMNIYIHV